MDELLLNFLGREREKTVRIGERTCAMRLLSARETLSLRREIAQLDCADEEERALRANAALIKRSLTEGGEAAFASAEDVENALSVGEINELVRCYALLDGAENPSSEDGREKVEALKKSMEHAPYERLKWRVLRYAGALPSEKRAQEMTDADYLYCLVHEMLDREEAMERLCPECRTRAEEARCSICGAKLGETAGGGNASFDMARFIRMKEGRKP